VWSRETTSHDALEIAEAVRAVASGPATVARRAARAPRALRMGRQEEALAWVTWARACCMGIEEQRRVGTGWVASRQPRRDYPPQQRPGGSHGRSYSGPREGVRAGAAAGMAVLPISAAGMLKR